MKISRLCIENLRGIEGMEFDLTAPDGAPRRRLVLLGGNGSGKSTTLAAIAHVLGQEDEDLGAARLGAGDIRQTGGTAPAISSELPRGRIAVDMFLSPQERKEYASYQQEMPPERNTLQVEIGTPLLTRQHELQDMLATVITRAFGVPETPTASRKEVATRVEEELRRRGIEYDQLDVSDAPVRRNALFDAAGRRVPFPEDEPYERCFVALIDLDASAHWAHPA